MAVAAAIALGAGAVAFTAALPASATTCQFGDNFYYFDSASTLNLQTEGGSAWVNDGGGGTLYCQTAGTTIDGYSAYEWVKKGTSLCLTLVDDSGQYYTQDDTCTGAANQYWFLGDVQTDGTWGWMANGSTTSDGNYWLFWDVGSGYTDKGACDKSGDSQCNESYSAKYQWTLDGPYP